MLAETAYPAHLFFWPMFAHAVAYNIAVSRALQGARAQAEATGSRYPGAFALLCDSTFPKPGTPPRQRRWILAARLLLFTFPLDVIASLIAMGVML